MIGEIMSAPADVRRVGIRFPDRPAAMTAATRVFRDLGLNVHIVGVEVWLEVPRPFALPAMQILERATGTPGFSEWEDAA